MKNNFDLRKFLTENKNSIEEEIEDRFADSAEEDLIQCVNNLGHTRYLSKEEAADEAIDIIEKHFLVNDNGEDLDEEVVNEDIEWFNLIPLGLGAVIGGLMVATGLVAERAIQAGLNGKFGDKVKNYLEKRSNEIEDFLDNDRNVQEEEMEESAPGYDHDCAAHVVHETYGYGLCLEGRHTLVETSKGRAEVTHYDVFFKNGSKIVENIPVEELVIESIEEHHHGKRKK